MARVTVEDCITKIPNRFKLVMLAGKRARDITAGAELLVDRDDDKNPVVALREIAEEKVAPAELMEAVVAGLQRHADTDEPEEEVDDESSDVVSAEEAIAHLSAARPVSRKEVIDYDKTTDSESVFPQKHSQRSNAE